MSSISEPLEAPAVTALPTKFSGKTEIFKQKKPENKMGTTGDVSTKTIIYDTYVESNDYVTDDVT